VGLWWLIGGDVVAQWWGCGGSLVGLWWLIGGAVVAHWWGCGGSLVGMWWLSGKDVVAHWWGCGGSLVGLWLLSGEDVVVAQWWDLVAQLRVCSGSMVKSTGFSRLQHSSSGFDSGFPQSLLNNDCVLRTNLGM
jgi:hypothetical protein